MITRIDVACSKDAFISDPRNGITYCIPINKTEVALVYPKIFKQYVGLEKYNVRDWYLNTWKNAYVELSLNLSESIKKAIYQLSFDPYCSAELKDDQLILSCIKPYKIFLFDILRIMRGENFSMVPNKSIVSNFRFTKIRECWSCRVSREYCPCLFHKTFNFKCSTCCVYERKWKAHLCEKCFQIYETSFNQYFSLIKIIQATKIIYPRELVTFIYSLLFLD